LRVFENRVLRRMRNERAESWIKLHNEELRNLYGSPNIMGVIISRIMRWMGHVARMGDMRNSYRIFVGIPKRKRPLGRPWHIWKYNLLWILEK